MNYMCTLSYGVFNVAALYMTYGFSSLGPIFMVISQFMISKLCVYRYEFQIFIYDYLYLWTVLISDLLELVEETFISSLFTDGSQLYVERL